MRAGPPRSGRAAGPVRDRPAHLAGGRFADARAGAPSGRHDRPRPCPRRASPRRPAWPACRTSSRPTTRRRTSRAWSTRRSRRCRRSPRRSRSSRSTTARATRRRRSPTTWPRAIRASCASSTTRRTSATARRCARASRRPATSSSPSPTATASSRSPTSGGSTARLAEADAPDVVVGFRIKRADPVIRTAYARAYRLANRIFFGLQVTDVDCACKLFRREALEGIRVESDGAFFSAELLIKLRRGGPHDRRGRRAALPADGRLARPAPSRRSSARRARLLAPAPVHVGEPGALAPPRGDRILGD